MAIRRLLLAAGIVVVLALGITALSLTPRAADAASPSPQISFYHLALTGQTLPPNGSTRIATIPFRVTRQGVFNLVSLQDVSLNGTCCGSLSPPEAMLTSVIQLDGSTISTISKSTTNGGAFSTTIDATIIHAVSSGMHTLAIIYQSSWHGNQGIVTSDGTLSLEVVSGAASD